MTTLAWPVDPKLARLRDPDAGFRHDGFGHDGSDGCIRIVPHSGLDHSGSGPIFSLAGGVVARSGWSPIAGWYLIEQSPLANRWIIYFHAAQRMLPQGTATRPGMQLGVIGATGSGAKGQHLHWSIATSLKAAISLVTIGVYLRGKRSTAEWAAAHGLVDPLPYLRRITAKADAPAAAAKPANPSAPAAPVAVESLTEEDDMYLIQTTKAEGGRVYLVTAHGQSHLSPTELGLVKRMLTRGSGGKVETFNATEVRMLNAAIKRAK